MTQYLTFSAPVTAADQAKRTITGQIVPWGQVGNTSVGPVVFELGSIASFDPADVKLLMQHDGTRPVGRGVTASVTPGGIVMQFRLAQTTSGTDALIEAADGLRDGLSVGASVDEYTIQNGVMHVTAATLHEVSLVTEPAFDAARVAQVAAQAAQDTPEAETAAEDNPQGEETMSEQPIETVEDVTAAAVVQAAAPVAFTTPRSPIKSQAQYLEHSVKAALGSRDSAEYVAHADAQARMALTAADDSFTTNPAFSPVQYVGTVVDTLIGARPAIDAIGTRALPAAGMTVSVPKITTSGTVAETAEAAAPSETGIVSSYVNLTVKKYSGLQRYSIELLERSDPSFYQAMLDNMTRAYNKATDSAVIAALTAGGTQATAVAASSDGIISYVSTEVPAAYLAAGELATAYIAGTSQWSLLMGAKDSSGRPIYNAGQPQNAGGSATPRSLRGDVLGLDLYVDPNAVATTIDESAFIVVPSSVAIYESPTLTLTSAIPTTGEIEMSLNGFMACGVLVAGGVRRFNLT